MYSLSDYIPLNARRCAHPPRRLRRFPLRRFDRQSMAAWWARNIEAGRQTAFDASVLRYLAADCGLSRQRSEWNPLIPKILPTQTASLYQGFLNSPVISPKPSHEPTTCPPKSPQPFQAEVAELLAFEVGPLRSYSETEHFSCSTESRTHPKPCPDICAMRLSPPPKLISPERPRPAANPHRAEQKKRIRSLSSTVAIGMDRPRS